VVFREGKRYTAPNAADEAILNEHFYRDIIEEPKPKPTPIEKQPTERQTEESLDDNPPPEPPKPKTKKSRELAGLETSLGDAWKPPAEGSRQNRSGKDTLAESTLLALEDEEFEDMIPIYTPAAISNNHDHEDGIDDPKSYKAANESPLAEKWDTAMKEELDAIGQHQVFGDFVELPEGRNVLPSRWVYKIKRDGAGNVQRYKARLVCGGNHQIEGIDYQATYTPTARLGHVRLALAIAGKYDYEIHQMDVCRAFLGVDLEEEIYMHPPQGYFRFVQTGSRYYDPRSKTSRKMVLLLRKSLYGLKQSLDVWYGSFKEFVISNGLVASRVDGGLFVLHDKDQGIVVAAVVLYVDDLLIIANEGLIGQIKGQMKKRFRIHDLGSVSFYLGMNIERNWEHHTIDIHQHSFIQMILAKFRMDESRPVATPMAMKLHKRKPDEEACDPTIYQMMIGSLMYAMTATRPDIAYAIGVLSQYNHDQSNEHMIALKRVFRYLNVTKDWRLRFGGEEEGALRCYVDSDYAGCPDDYKSTSGLVITFAGAVDWRSRKQKSTAPSTTDAKFYAFGVGCMTLTQISHILNELGIPTIRHMFSDSQILIASIKNRIYRGTAVAHIATKYYLAEGMARDGKIDLSYVPTAEMLADCFTKPLPKPAFLKQYAAMGMIGIGLGNGLSTLTNGRGNGIGIGKGIGNAVGK